MPKLENQANSRVSGKKSGKYGLKAARRAPQFSKRQLRPREMQKTLEIQRFRGFSIHEKTFLDLFREWNII